MVGTVDYIAPEVFGKDGYTELVDWWSIGTILFEMLIGYPPFYGKDPTTTLKHVMQYRKYLKIPKEANISKEAADLIKSLITVPEERLGKKGVDEIKKHPFFKNIDWRNMHKKIAPFIPRITNPEDTSNFEKFEDADSWISIRDPCLDSKRDYVWIGYTYKKPQLFNNKNEIDEIFQTLKQKKENERKRQFSEERIELESSNHFERNRKDESVRNINSQKYNFSKKKPQYVVIDPKSSEDSKFSLNIDNKFCMSMTEAENANRLKLQIVTHDKSFKSNLKSKGRGFGLVQYTQND